LPRGAGGHALLGIEDADVPYPASPSHDVSRSVSTAASRVASRAEAARADRRQSGQFIDVRDRLCARGGIERARHQVLSALASRHST